MRVIHDVRTPMCVSGGGHGFANDPGKQGYAGSQIEILMCEGAAANHPNLPPQMFGDNEVIHIHGNSKYIVKMLEDALNICRSLEAVSKERLGELRDTDCPNGCAGIDRFNGNHLITCPRHPNYEYFKQQRGESGV